MRVLDFRTAGESHGKGILAVVSGIPYGVEIDVALIDANLARRQKGYGRSARQKIERDRAEILTGTRGVKTLGGPVTLLVPNADHRIERYRTLERPRPGHADLPGAMKYGITDVADVMERASARETAGRVAAGSLAQCVLRSLGIQVFAHTCAIGEVELTASEATREAAAAIREASPLLSLDPAGDAKAVAFLDAAKKSGETVGGRFRVVATGLPPGLGSHTQWDARLSGRLMQAVGSIQAIKAVEIGCGRASGAVPGSKFHDPIVAAPTGDLTRASNNAGGLEGGMTNGMPLVVEAAMKPIPTLLTPLDSVNLVTGEPEKAVYERSDVCAVPAAGVVGEAMVALVLLDAVLEKFGCDTFEEVSQRLDAYRRALHRGVGAER